jgi:hypothetical protein
MVTAARLIPLADLVEICDGDNLPLVADLDPYRLGTTPTDYGDSASYGERDPYVPRTSKDVDLRLRAALQPGRIALLVGPSNVGKTRTAFRPFGTAAGAVGAERDSASCSPESEGGGTADPWWCWLMITKLWTRRCAFRNCS